MYMLKWTVMNQFPLYLRFTCFNNGMHCWLRINVLTIISKLNRRTILYLFNMNISFSVLVSLA